MTQHEKFLVGFSWPNRRTKLSDTWKRAYAEAIKRNTPGPDMNHGEAESGRWIDFSSVRVKFGIYAAR